MGSHTACSSTARALRERLFPNSTGLDRASSFHLPTGFHHTTRSSLSTTSARGSPFSSAARWGPTVGSLQAPRRASVSLPCFPLVHSPTLTTQLPLLLCAVLPLPETTFGSTCHGAGRARSRTNSRRNLDHHAILEALARQNIAIRVASPKVLIALISRSELGIPPRLSPILFISVPFGPARDGGGSRELQRRQRSCRDMPRGWHIPEMHKVAPDRCHQGLRAVPSGLRIFDLASLCSPSSAQVSKRQMLSSPAFCCAFNASRLLSTSISRERSHRFLAVKNNTAHPSVPIHKARKRKSEREWGGGGKREAARIGKNTDTISYATCTQPD